MSFWLGDENIKRNPVSEIFAWGEKPHRIFCLLGKRRREEAFGRQFMLKTRYLMSKCFILPYEKAPNSIELLLTCRGGFCVFNLSRGLGEAFGHGIIRWEAEIVAQMLHPYSWFVYSVVFL
jgi:hypothetical protein